MKRRAFLRGIGAVGGAALASGVARPSAAARARISERLRQAGIGVTARVSRFEGAKVDASEVALAAGSVARRSIAGNTLVLQATARAEQPDAIDLLLIFSVRQRPTSASLDLRLALGAWSRADYLVLPGACYAGNRFESRHIAYPPLLTERADIGPNVPPIISDIPRLNVHAGASRLDCLVADLAWPAAGVFSPAKRLGLVLLVDPLTSIGPTGFSVTENDDRTSADIVLSAPSASERVNPPAAGATPRHPHRALIDSGQQVTLRARLLVFDCEDVPSLYARLFAVRKQLTGSTARVHELPFSASFAAHEERVNSRWVETPGFYAVGARTSPYATWQTGWGGGLAATLPLLAEGAPRSRDRARRTTEFCLAEGQAPSGFFHALSDGKTWYEDGFGAPVQARPAAPFPVYKHAQRWHLVRRSADALWSLVNQLALYERRPNVGVGETQKTTARLAAGARRAADAFVRLWDRFHQFGQFVDVDTGDLRVGGSTSAGLAPAALALAAVHFKHDGYLRVARAAAEHYYDRYVSAGLTAGGPGDALQCPDSGSAAALLESFVTLHDVTRERPWIERARVAAHLLSSWVISYEPAGAAGDGRDLRATGGVLWDAQSARGSPGILISSGDALFRLYRATGDVALLELLRDTVHNLAQYLRCREGRESIEAAARTGPAGGVVRTDTRAWLELPGGIVPAAGAFDAIGLLATTQVPGLYAQVDSGFVFAFDHVDARVKERLAGKLIVALTNPTPTEAKVRLYVEASADTSQPLRPGAVVDAPTALVPPGATVDVVLSAPLAARR